VGHGRRKAGRLVGSQDLSKKRLIGFGVRTGRTRSINRGGIRRTGAAAAPS